MNAHTQSATLRSISVERGNSRRAFTAFAWLVLAYNIPVILWGAYVRVSFSGDGCGANWPFCQGQVIPQHMSVPTIIELTHRMMTGIDTVLVLAMCVLAFRLFPAKHAVRRFSLWSLLFLFIEALLGAGLVLFRMVAKDQSAGRAWYLSAHLTNTLLLLAALTVTAWVAGMDLSWVRLKKISGPMMIGLVAAIFVAVTGAVAALGDMLYPAASLPAGIRQDFAASSSALLRLRTFHPFIAIAGAAYLLWLAAKGLKQHENASLRAAAGAVAGVTVIQLAAGMVNLSLLAPIWMQLVHLLIADILWVALVVLALQSAIKNYSQPEH